MTHDDARLLLSAVADREATAPPELETHLAQCARCAAYAGELDRLATLTAALPRPAAPPSLPGRVTRRIRRRRWALRLAPALAAATAAAVVVTNLPAPGFPLPPAAAAEPLLRLRSLYVERTVTTGRTTTYEKVWWRAPGSVRIERRIEQPGGGYDSLVVETPHARYLDGEVTVDRAPAITLPEPVSPTVALLGTDAGPGPTVAGLPTRRYDVSVGGERRTVYVADGLALAGTDSIVVAKLGQGPATKTTQVLRVNPDLSDDLFEIPAGVAPFDEGFRKRPLAGLAIEPASRPAGFATVRAGRGPEGEAYLLSRGSLPVLVEDGGLSGVAEQRRVTYRGREYLVGIDLYAPPRVQLTTRAGVVTVSAPLPLDSLVALATGMYGVE